MEGSQLSSALEAAKASVTAHGLRAEDAVVINDSNRIAVRLLPGDVLARVAPMAHLPGSEIEIAVARQLAEAGSPMAGPHPRFEPRVHLHNGFALTFWTYYDPTLPLDFAPGEYAEALQRLHAGMRGIELEAPHCTDRIAEAQEIVADRTMSPDLGEADRELLGVTLRELRAAISQRGATEQLIHGEPHPGNVLRTKDGLLFTDLETCCRGPVEWDIAHYSRVGPEAWYVDAALPDLVGQQYPGADLELIRVCWMTMLAIVSAWRWDRNDRFPDGHRMRQEWTAHVRDAVNRYGMDAAV